MHPLPVPDPPKSPSIIDLPPTDGSHAITDAFTGATDLDVVGEESAMKVSPPRVSNGTVMERGAILMHGLDPGSMPPKSLITGCQQHSSV